jgi:glyoxylase-like metal-dependent hydrolase (beta-lactamase superfamily II)
VLITGDLLVNPVSFALSCYPAGWLRTLGQLEALDASVIVPGHGEPLPDKQLLRDTEEVFRILLREGRAAKKRGVDVDAARPAILASIEGPMGRMTKGDPGVKQAFAVQLVDWFLHRVYEEADGVLTDAIAPIPKK